MTDHNELVRRLREPVDWAHFVSDDHALDYQTERREAADAIDSLVRELAGARAVIDVQREKLSGGPWDRLEAAEARCEKLATALTSYRDEFKAHVGRPVVGASSITFHPSPALLEDCGNRAMAALKATP